MLLPSTAEGPKQMFPYFMAYHIHAKPLPGRILRLEALLRVIRDISSFLHRKMLSDFIYCTFARDMMIVPGNLQWLK